MKAMKGGERNGKGLQKEGRNKWGSSVLRPLESQEMPDSWVSGFVFSGPLQSLDTKVAASNRLTITPMCSIVRIAGELAAWGSVSVSRHKDWSQK